MAALINLPSYQVPNALSFQGINSGIDSAHQQGQRQVQNALMQRQMGMQEKQLGMQTEKHGLQMAGMKREQEVAEARRVAGTIQGLMALPEAQRLPAWQHQLTQPGFRDLPENMRDFNTAAPLLMAKAAEYMDPLTKQKTQAEIALMGNKGALARAQATAAGQKSEIEAAIARILNEQPQGGAPAPQGGVQPQSFGGLAPQGGVMPVGGPQQAPQGVPQAQGPQGDPNLILAQAPPQGAPPPQAEPDPSGAQDIVQTPLGPRTREQAQRLGFALALGGKGDAGKMMNEYGQQGMPGKEARNEIEKRLFAATEQKARLSAIRSTFKPEWQTVDEQLKQYGISWVDSIGPLRDKIPPAQRQRHAEYTRYRQEAFMNMNQYIKDMTGAAMSEMEANRLRKGIPDPERDGPTAFESKLENSAAQADLAMARHTYLLKKGFQGKPWESGVSLERMQGIINQRGAQVEKIMREQNPNAPAQAIQREAFRVIKQEFGI